LNQLAAADGYYFFQLKELAVADNPFALSNRNRFFISIDYYLLPNIEVLTQPFGDLMYLRNMFIKKYPENLKA
jgi:hypothetical protein